MERINLFTVIPQTVEESVWEHYWTDHKSHAVRNRRFVKTNRVVFGIFDLLNHCKLPALYNDKEEAEYRIGKLLRKYSDYELGCLAFRLGQGINNQESDEFQRGYSDQLEWQLKVNSRDNLVKVTRRKRKNKDERTASTIENGDES
jgi:hypothetical protein